EGRVPAGRRGARGPAAEAANRRAVHRLSLLRQSADDRLADPAGGASQPQAGATPDAADGPGGDLSQAPTESGGTGASDLSLPAAGREDRAARPSLERRHHLRADGDGIYVSGGDDRLVQPLRGGLAAVEHARRLVLHGDAPRGLW